MHKFIFVVIGLILVSGCEKKQAEEILRPVRTQEVVVFSGDQNRTFSGVTSAGLSATLSFKVGGTVLKKHVQTGDKVKQGDVLAELDPTDYQLQSQEISASLNQYQAALRKDEANYKRVKTLYENQNTSLNDLDAARAGYEASRSAVEALQKKLELAQLQIEYTQLKAPQDGIIANVHVEINENVGSGTRVIELSSKGDFEITVGMPESFISRVKKGDSVDVKLASVSQKLFPGTVKTVSYVSSESSTYPVKITLLEKSDNIRPGMPADVTFHFADKARADVMIVPSHSVAEDQSGKFVFVVVPSGTAGVGLIQRKAVEVGPLTNAGFEILSGLTGGDKVVTAGVSNITNGMKVKLLQ